MTKTPAMVLGIYNEVGSLDPGKWANFLITSGPIFNANTTIYQNWIRGSKYIIKDEASGQVATYKLAVNFPTGTATYTLEVKKSDSAILIAKDTMNSKFSFDGKMVKLDYAPFTPRQKDIQTDYQKPDDQQQPPVTGKGSREEPLPASAIRLSGVSNGRQWNGTGVDSAGTTFTWTATRVKETDAVRIAVRKQKIPLLESSFFHSNHLAGRMDSNQRQETILIKNATVWTNESEGVIQNADVLIKNGKMAGVGKNLSDASARVIDGVASMLLLALLMSILILLLLLSMKAGKA